MKFDMHCHTKEGSLDGKVELEDYIEILKEKGFGGMLITDHNSYRAYRHYKKYIRGKKHTDFVVLKGIEYDTRDAGHMIIVMPEDVKLKILELRGLSLLLLMEIVHKHGGIIGPAHPCGGKYLSICNTKKHRRLSEIYRLFDFVEVFNACESPESNQKAFELAAQSDLPGFGGSDAHRADCVGRAYAELPDYIKCESQLINYVKNKGEILTGGEYYNKTTKDKMGTAHVILEEGFWWYNQLARFWRQRKVKKEVREDKLVERYLKK